MTGHANSIYQNNYLMRHLQNVIVPDIKYIISFSIMMLLTLYRFTGSLVMKVYNVSTSKVPLDRTNVTL